MDEITLLRQIGSDPSPPTAEVMAEARLRLVGHALDVHRQPRRRWWRASVAAGVAVLAAGGVVIGEATLKDPVTHRVIAEASAVEVLHRAVRATLHTKDPVVGPQQYLRVRTVGDYVTGPGGRVEYGDPTLFLTRGVTSLYVPGSPNRPWVLDRGPLRAVRLLLGHRGDQPPFTPGQIERARRGAFGGPVTPTWQTPTTKFLAALPRDPAQLLSRIRHDAGGSGPSRNAEVVVTVADVLRSGLVPADLRASLFEALQLVPGVTVTDPVTVMNGRRGVAVGRLEPSNHERQELVFDRATGLLIGERTVAVSAVDNIPAGTVTESTSVTTTVVDASRVP